jgi:hypothetical protein
LVIGTLEPARASRLRYFALSGENTMQFSVGGWHDVVDPERSRMEIVEAYQASISDNVMQRKKGPEKSSSDSERST